MAAMIRMLAWLIGRRRREAELDDELRFHLEEEAEELRAAGMAEGAARSAARRELGNVALVREDTRAAWGWVFAEQLLQDVRYALRTMAGNKAFTALAALSLALGIGANTAIFSFMDAILLRSLPVRDPGSLEILNWHANPVRRSPDGARTFVLHSMSGSTWKDANGGPAAGIFPYGAFVLFQANQTVFSALFAYLPAHQKNVAVRGQAERVAGEYVSGDYFRGLGIVPAAGRLIVPDDDRAGAPAVAVISARLAERYFGSAENATGQEIRINNHPFTVAGVAPPEFFGVNPAENPDFYVPLHRNVLLESSYDFSADEYLDRHDYWLEMMGRLRPGVTPAQAGAALAPLFHNWVADTAANDRERANLPMLRLREGASGVDSLRREYSKPLFVLLAMVGLILGIACANTANLLLARAAARQREMALRLSLGAGRLRLVRQLLTESIVLASLGGALGVLVGVWAMRFLTVLLANGEESFTLSAELNWHVLAATLTLSVLCGTLFGLAPALRSTQTDLRTARRTRFQLSHVLVASQIAVSLLMLVAAGLFVRTLSNLESVPLGFNPDHVLLFDVNARQAGHGDSEIAAFYERLRQRLAAIPGVRAATLAHSSIIGAGRGLSLKVGQVDASKAKILNIGPEFFSTMQIAMRMGSPKGVVVNDVFARQYFATENPLGRRLTLGGPHPRDMAIAGVCANIRYGGLKQSYRPVVFIPYDEGDWPPVNQMTFALRTAGDPLNFAAAAREIVRQADARAPVTSLMSQNQEIGRSINQEVIFARLCSAFAILAMAIACVGLYGTVSYQVARRTGEIGLRMALGAPRSAVVWMVMRGTFVLATVGIAISVPAALEGAALVESFLFGIPAAGAGAVLGPAAILLAAALAAAYVPARRASRIDPMAALRSE